MFIVLSASILVTQTCITFELLDCEKTRSYITVFITIWPPNVPILNGFGSGESLGARTSGTVINGDNFNFWAFLLV